MITNLKSKLTGRQIAIGAAVAVVLCLVSGILLYSSVKRFHFTDDGFFPVDSMVYEIKKGDTAKLEDGKDYANLKLGDTVFSGRENAVYYRNKKGLAVLSQWEVVTKPENGVPGTWRISCFTELEQSGRSYVVTSGEKTNVANAAFLYNGEDTYIVLEDALLTVGEFSAELPAFSYVIANRSNWVQYRNRKTEEYGMIELDETSSVELELKESEIRIFATGDRFECGNQEFMLISEVSFLNEIGEQ